MKILAALTLLAPLAMAQSSAPTPEQAQAIRIYDDAIPYLSLSNDALRALFHDLDGLKPDTAQGPGDLPASLLEAGEIVADQIPRIPNLIAREDIAEERFMPRDLRRSGPEFEPVSWRHFEYVVQANNHLPNETEFLESRKDLAKKPSNKPIHGTGFGALWLIFIPDNLTHSHFRYLGRQKIDGAETFVVAFAEDPNKVPHPGVIEDPMGTVPLLHQGLVWIDQESFRIVRIRTDLLRRLPQIELDNVSSTASFSEVRIPELSTPLWLPRQVELTWRAHGVTAGELHRYSNYQLFRSTVRILPN